MKEEEKEKYVSRQGGLQSVYRLKELLKSSTLWNPQFSICLPSRTEMVSSPGRLVSALSLEYPGLSVVKPRFIFFFFCCNPHSTRGSLWHLLSAKSVKTKVLYIPYSFILTNINVIKVSSILKRHAGGTAGRVAKVYVFTHQNTFLSSRKAGAMINRPPQSSHQPKAYITVTVVCIGGRL